MSIYSPGSHTRERHDEWRTLRSVLESCKNNIDLFGSLIGSVIQLAVTVSVYSRMVPRIFWDAPYAVVGGIWLATCGLSFIPWKRPPRILTANSEQYRPVLMSGRMRSAALVIATGVAIAALWVVHREATRRSNDPLNPPPINLPSVLLDTFGGVLHAQTLPPVTVALVTGETSLSATYTGSRLTIVPDQRILARLVDGAHNESSDETAERPQLVSWLQERARSRVSAAEASRITDLIALTRDRPDIVNRLMPTVGEFGAMMPSEQSLVRHWAARYVGVWAPRLRLTIDNSNGGMPLNIQSISFQITYVDFAERATFASQLNSAVLDTLFVRLVPRITTVDVRWDAVSNQSSLISPHAAPKLDVVLIPDPQQSGRAKHITCIGRLTLKTSLGELPAGEISLDTFNSWSGAAQRR